MNKIPDKFWGSLISLFKSDNSYSEGLDLTKPPKGLPKFGRDNEVSLYRGSFSYIFL